MLKYDFVGLKMQTISGVKNPMLTLVGTKNLEMDFEITADGKKLEFSYDTLPSSDDFCIRAIIPFKAKFVKVYVIVDGKRNLILDRKMSIISRIKHKVWSEVKGILIFLRAVFVTLFKGIKFFWKQYHFLVPPKLWGKYFKDFCARVKVRGVKMYNEPNNLVDYNTWIRKYENSKLETIEFEYKPLISILIPVYNIGKDYLSQCIDSILNQTYDNFEICLVDDCSTKEETKQTLEYYKEKDKRVHVKYRKENGHISRTTNDALEMANGEYIALVDDDDEITTNALQEVVKALNNDKTIDMIYSDEDKLDSAGRRCFPNFKPDWSPDTLLSLNYICHLTVLRKSIVDEIGGFTVGLEGAQDYDLFLRFTEKAKNIHHIEKILYHWRMVEGSTSMVISNKNYAVERGKQAIENALKRRKISGSVKIDQKSTYYIVNYDLKKEPLVSIIIPTKDFPEVLDACLKSLYERTIYKNFEVIIMNNNSNKEETYKLFDKYKKEHKNFKVYDANYEFNYSKINNEAVKKAKGEYVCLLNNDTEIISPDWLSTMVGYASQDHVGAVGPKLLYPDETVQHGGVILGLGGVASHSYIGASREDFGDFGRLRVPYDYAAVTAACLVVSRGKYLSVDGLDESLKVAYNDIDFNIKLLKEGYFNMCLPQVEIFHFESKSRGYDNTSDKYKRFREEEKYMYNKWGEIINNDPFYNSNFSKNAWFKLNK